MTSTSGMFKTTKILILEDSPEDAELMTREISRAGFRIDYRLVDDETTFRSMLANFRPDVILADYVLPTFSGFDALQITQSISPEVPFIFVTGAIGEEIAAETILNGAAGFVLKSNLHKIAGVLEKIVNEYEGWHNPRIAYTNRIVRERIQSNIKSIEKIHEFLEKNRVGSGSDDPELDDAINNMLDLKNKLSKDEEDNSTLS